jgi:hypothetical protein
MVFRRRPGVAEREEVEVIVKPAERIRNGAMQIPERVTFGNLNAPPDGGIGLEQCHLELKHMGKGTLTGIHLL